MGTAGVGGRLGLSESAAGRIARADYIFTLAIVMTVLPPWVVIVTEF